MNFLKPAKYFITISAILVVVSLGTLVYPGPNLSIDFTGGTLLEIRGDNLTRDSLDTTLQNAGLANPLGPVSVNTTQDDTYLIRMRYIEPEEHTALGDYLESTITNYTELQFTTIGSVVGSTMKQRSIWALFIASVAIVCYIAFAFRKIPRKLSPWRFGIVAVITLLHDVIITTGIFVILSQTTSFQFDTLFITALLTILGYSVNDTIIIFDRIRDNLFNQERKEPFEQVANRSLNESITRSINTTGSTLIMLGSLFLFGSESIRWFILTLIIGAFIGTYSSIFIATPMLVYWRKNKK